VTITIFCIKILSIKGILVIRKGERERERDREREGEREEINGK